MSNFKIYSIITNKKARSVHLHIKLPEPYPYKWTNCMLSVIGDICKSTHSWEPYYEDETGFVNRGLVTFHFWDNTTFDQFVDWCQNYPDAAGPVEWLTQYIDKETDKHLREMT